MKAGVCSFCWFVCIKTNYNNYWQCVQPLYLIKFSMTILTLQNIIYIIQKSYLTTLYSCIFGFFVGLGLLLARCWSLLSFSSWFGGSIDSLSSSSLSLSRSWVAFKSAFSKGRKSLCLAYYYFFKPGVVLKIDSTQCSTVDPGHYRG